MGCKVFISIGFAQAFVFGKSTFHSQEDMMSKLIETLLGLATPLFFAAPKKKVAKKAAKKKVVKKVVKKKKTVKPVTSPAHGLSEPD